LISPKLIIPLTSGSQRLPNPFPLGYNAAMEEQPTSPPQPQPVAVSAVVSSTPPPARRSPWLKTALFIMLAFIMGAGTGAGAMYWYNQTNHQSIHASSPTPTPSAMAHTPTVTPTPDPTAGWQTYTDPNKLYSFKYPPAWKLTKTFKTNGNDQADKTQYEDIQLKIGEQPVAIITYPFELSGCGESKERAYIFGDKPVVMYDICANSPEDAGMYLGWFYNPKLSVAERSDKEKNGLGLVIGYHLNQSTEADFINFAKSVTDLDPKL
jgi:hypothetical protein